jgi:hypothetical protein
MARGKPQRSYATPFTLQGVKRAIAAAAAMGVDLEVGPFIFRTSKGGATSVPGDGRSDPARYANRHDFHGESETSGECA